MLTTQASNDEILAKAILIGRSSGWPHDGFIHIPLLTDSSSNGLNGVQDTVQPYTVQAIVKFRRLTDLEMIMDRLPEIERYCVLWLERQDPKTDYAWQRFEFFGGLRARRQSSRRGRGYFPHSGYAWSV